MANKELTLFVNFVAKDGSEGIIKKELLKLIEPTRAEEGHITYVLHFDNENEKSFYFYEIWEDYDAWQKHRKTEHMQKFYAIAEEHLAQRIVYQASVEEKLNLQKIIKSQDKESDDVVTVIAIIKAKEGYKDKLYSHLAKLIEGTHNEEACIDYILHIDNEDENTFLFYENWKDAKGLDEHNVSKHMQEYVEQVKDMLAEVQVSKASKAQ